MSEGIRLYNTLTRSKEPFAPIDPDNVRLYVCGPTVYDYAHVGNARPAIVFDVLFRLLRHVYGAEHVTYVRNITDVDDKINARALRDFGAGIEAGTLSLNEAIRKVTETTYDQYQKDVAALGCLPPTEQPRATEHIPQMRALIDRLVERGVAYVAEDHVLFSPKAMNGRPGLRYGSLSKRPFDEMLAGARVDVASYKRDEMDFVLWKPSKPGEPGWPSPAGIAVDGRPGWHIECSAMSMAKLLEPYGGGLTCDDPTKNMFDIHGGGLDLIFPHHENEIAQSCCALGTEAMAKVWMHNGFLQVEGRKMSKSEGNFVTIRENLRGSFPSWQGGPWHGLVLRCAMLMTHYRQPIDWTLDRLLEARSKVWKWNLFISNWRSQNWAEFQRKGFKAVSASPFQEVVDALADDLNTPLAISFLTETLERPDFKENVDKLISSLLLIGLLDDLSLSASAVMTSEVSRSGSNIETFSLASEIGIAHANNDIELLENLSEKLEREGWTYQWLSPGHIDLKRIDSSTKLNIDVLIKHRLALIAKKNWAEADRIRDELLAQGIQLKDGKDPATGERITTWEVKR